VGSHSDPVWPITGVGIHSYPNICSGPARRRTDGPRGAPRCPRIGSSNGHPCKSLSTEKHKIFWARLGERAIRLIRILRYAVLPLGWWFLLSAEPDIHLLSETPKSPHRRLSLCSLPVPKQTDGSLGSCLRRSARHLRDLAACAPSNPDVFHSWEGFHAAAVPLHFPVSTKSCFLRSTASM
jgi:hypothetical protein